MNGFALVHDEHVLVTREELTNATPIRTEMMENLDFVELGDIDPYFFRQRHYVALRALFVTFLARNNPLINVDGQPKFTNNALATLTLMVAMSGPTEKDSMVAFITKMLAGIL